MEVKSWRIGLSICYDVRFSELYSNYAKEGAHLILVPSAFLVPTGAAHWHILLRARAIESQAFVIAAAQAGEHVGVHGEKRTTYGHSLAIDPWGEILADLGEAGPKVEVVTLDPARLERVWRQIPQAQHRRLR
jgi:predicted amidohydrolase